MSLIARDLSVAPPGAPDPVVRGFSMEVGAGEWVALSGANGSGKTSVALTLAGLWPAWAGEVTLEGEPIARARERGAIAVVLQEPSSQLLEPTVADELAFAARNLSVPEDTIAREAQRWAACFGLQAELGSDPRALSAGRQQLVLIAAALVAGPRFLVADEAGAHLDVDSRALVLEELRLAVGEGLGVLWVTQDSEEAARARREVVLGAPAAPDAPAGPAAPAALAARSSPGTIALRIRVAPWDGRAGPHVNCGQALLFEAPTTGVAAIVGGNGAGKSVLLSAAAGLLRLGQVEVSLARPEPPPIFSGQYPELEMFEERVADEVAFAAVSRGMPRTDVLAEAGRAFDRLGLPGRAFLGRRSFELSAGEKRLVQSVAALLAPASVVILDEPTAGLDPAKRLALAVLVGERSALVPVLVASQDAEWLGWLGASIQRVGDPIPSPRPTRRHRSAPEDSSHLEEADPPAGLRPEKTG